MWEDLKIYRQLDKKDINPTFKLFGKKIHSLIDNYSIIQTTSVIKIFRKINSLEQAVYIEKRVGTYGMDVKTSIKPVDFYLNHKFTRLNVVPLGKIMNNHRRTSYPLTKEWDDLANYLATRIKLEIEEYFKRYDSHEKIIKRRKEIEPEYLGLDNIYELLIYSAIKTKRKDLLIKYLDQKMSRPVMGITYSEFLKPGSDRIDEMTFLEKIRNFAINDDFDKIEIEIENVKKK